MKVVISRSFSILAESVHLGSFDPIQHCGIVVDLDSNVAVVTVGDSVVLDDGLTRFVVINSKHRLSEEPAKQMGFRVVLGTLYIVFCVLGVVGLSVALTVVAFVGIVFLLVGIILHAGSGEPVSENAS